MSHVYYLLGEGGAVSARPVSLPHRPGEGVSRSGSGPRGWTDRPAGWLRGGRGRASFVAGDERLYSLLTWWGCSGQGCHEVSDELLLLHHVACYVKSTREVWIIMSQTRSYCSSHRGVICEDLSPPAGTASDFWALKVKPWKFSTGTKMLKSKSRIYLFLF